MKEKVKAMARDAMTIGFTGVGLGVMGSVGGGEAIGKLGKSVGTVGSIAMMGHGLGMLQNMVPKKKKY